MTNTPALIPMTSTARRIWSRLSAASLTAFFAVVSPTTVYAHGGEEEVLPAGEFVIDYSVPTVDGATATSSGAAASPALALIGIATLVAALAFIYIRHTRTNNPDKGE